MQFLKDKFNNRKKFTNNAVIELIQCIFLFRPQLTLYDLGERISSVFQNFDFKIRRDHGKYESVDDSNLS